MRSWCSLLLHFVLMAVSKNLSASSDQPGAAIISEIGPGPVDHHEQPVAKSDQEPDMGETPGEPCQESGEPDMSEIGHRRLPADRREIAPVAVDEGRRAAPP